MKFKIIIIPIMALSLTGCDLLFPGNPPPKLCKEENRILSETELVHATLDFFYDDPLGKLPTVVPEGRSSFSYKKKHNPMIHFAHFKDAYIRNNNNAKRDDIIADYYKQFPNCCLVKYPADYYIDPAVDWMLIGGYKENDKANGFNTHYWTYDVFLFPDTAPDASFTVQKKYFLNRMAKAKQEKPEYLPKKWPFTVKGLSACGIVGIINYTR